MAEKIIESSTNVRDLSQNMIELDNVNKWYGDFHVLKDINLNVGKGEIVVVAGPSGSGKSTMIRCINRLEEYQEGIIKVKGVRSMPMSKTSRDPLPWRHGLPAFHLFPHLNTLGKILDPLAPRMGVLWGKIPKKEGAFDTRPLALSGKPGPYFAQKGRTKFP